MHAYCTQVSSLNQAVLYVPTPTYTLAWNLLKVLLDKQQWQCISLLNSTYIVIAGTNTTKIGYFKLEFALIDSFLRFQTFVQ